MKTKFNLPNIKAYIQGNWRSVLLEYYPDGLDKHLEEQYYWRISQVQEKSPECLKGKCKICSCDTPELFMSDKACSNNPPCYPEMMSKEDWNKLKIPYGGTLEENTITSGPMIIRDMGKEETFKVVLNKNHFGDFVGFRSDLEIVMNNINKYSQEALEEAYCKNQTVPIIIFPENANLADLLQANPTLTKEELLYWLPEFKDK